MPVATVPTTDVVLEPGAKEFAEAQTRGTCSISPSSATRGIFHDS